MIAKKHTLMDRVNAYVNTLNTITLAADEMFVTNEPRIAAALIEAAAALVIGTDLTKPGIMGGMSDPEDPE